MSLQLFDALEPAVEAALRASIRRWGVLVPIFTSAGPWQPGTIIDGHHRSRIAEEEGCGPPAIIALPVQIEDDALELARTLNMDRRHLDVEQRRLVVADLRAEGHSLRAIAGAVGVSHPTVIDDLRSTGKDLPVDVPDRIVGRDGKSRPATRPVPPPPDQRIHLDNEATWLVEELERKAARAAERNEQHRLAEYGRNVAAEMDAEEAERFPRDAQWQLLIDPLTRLAQVDLDMLEEGPPRITNWVPVIARIDVDLHRIANVIEKYAEGEP